MVFLLFYKKKIEYASNFNSKEIVHKIKQLVYLNDTFYVFPGKVRFTLIYIYWSLSNNFFSAETFVVKMPPP